jgi:serine phosphatase RsbU (regulator of sigma subunit)
MTSAYRPAREVGGDFFQILPVEVPGQARSTLIVLGDVSGKGLKAAMAVSFIVGALRALVEEHSAPADLLAQLNRRLTGRLQGGFATCLALRVASDGRCTVASAGHPAPLLNGRELALPGALPLGITADADYASIEFALAPGDHLALYTDGLLEARSPSGELYGFERLGALFATGPSAAQAAGAAVRFGQDDDITVLTLVRSKPSGKPAHLAPATAV